MLWPSLSKLVICSCSILIASAVEVRSAHEHRACKSITDDKDGALSAGQDRVIEHPGRFDYLRRQYQFKTFSIWGKYTEDADVACIRYEVQNLENERIQALSWRDAGIHFVDIESLGRTNWVRQYTPPYPALNAITEINAFQSSSETVRAYLPSTPKHAAINSPQKYGTELEANLGLANYRLDQSSPEVLAAVERAGLTSDNIVAVRTGPDAGSGLKKPLNLLTSFKNADMEFIYSSRVENEGKFFRISETLKFYSAPSQIEILMPYVQTLESLKAVTCSPTCPRS